MSDAKAIFPTLPSEGDYISIWADTNMIYTGKVVTMMSPTRVLLDTDWPGKSKRINVYLEEPPLRGTDGNWAASWVTDGD